LKRDRIFQRDEFRCVYCGEQFAAEELTLDHVEARVRRGDRSEGNLVSACRACNTRKGHQRVSDFLRESEVARENFFRYAVHVWPRILEAIREDLR
jgi:5-methylcytosine-specific restriction endonuclease McrA